MDSRFVRPKRAILDAALIQSSARPNKDLEMVAQDRQEEDAPETVCNVPLFKDPHATWLKKAKRFTLGYKGFMTVDVNDGFVEHVYVTPGHVSEMTEFAHIVPDLEPCHRLYDTVNNILNLPSFFSKPFDLRRL